MAKNKTARKVSVKAVKAKPKAVAFYMQPIAALSNGFDKVFSFFK